MRLSRRAVWAAAAVGLPASEFGHALGYTLRYGGRAAAAQSTGTHHYFPSAFASALAVLGMVAVAAMVMIALGRLLGAHRRNDAVEPGWSLAPVFALVLAIQGATFLAQETAEGSLALGVGAFQTGAVWGWAGQLLVAIVVAVALTWLSSRVRRAVRRLADPRLLGVHSLNPVAVAVAPGARSLTLEGRGQGPTADRGPPASA